MPRLFLIKHSMPEPDPAIPAPEWRLGERGRALGELLADRLAAYSIDIIVSSTEPKAVETARIVADRLSAPMEIAEGLHEHDRRSVPLMPRVQWEARIAEFFASPDELVLGGETAAQAHRRFSHAVARVMEKHAKENIAVVAHGTVISLFAARRAGPALALWKRLGLPSVVVLSLPGLDVQEVIENVE